MKIAAAYAIANSVKEEDLDYDFILPKAFDLSVQKAVSNAVRDTAIKTGVSKL